ncbi:MAG: hypothetical protein M0Z66_12445 [Thermaerobacter sp.]|nr:hypothetical protein [Thermaerobacter sp.]
MVTGEDILLAFEEYRNALLRASPIAEGARLDADWLALRHVLDALTPAAVNESSWHGADVIWIELSMKLPDWAVERWDEPPDWVKDVAESSEPIASSEAPHPTLAICYVPSRWGESDPRLTATMLVHDFMETVHRRALIPLVEGWRRQEMAAWAHVGWREWRMRVPSRMAPCHEVQAVARFDRGRGTTHPLTYADVKKDLQAVRLHRAVPEAVFEVFNRAAKLYLYGYRDWEFFSMAEWPATVALETSLRVLYAQEQVYPAEVVAREQTKGHPIVARQTVQGAGGLWYAIQEVRRQAGRRAVDVLVNGERLRDSMRKLLDWAASAGWVAPTERWRWKSGFSTRDQLSHPEGVSIRWISHAYAEVAQAALLINRLWMRYYHPEEALWKNAYVSEPRWKRKANGRSR